MFIEKRIGEDILPLLRIALDNNLYVPGFAANYEFNNLLASKRMALHTTPIESLAFALLYKDNKPIAWIFYRENVVWSFTVPELRKQGINNFLLDNFKNPFVKETWFAHPHPKWIDGTYRS